MSEIENLSQEETLFLNDPLSYFGKDPVTFPVSDGSTVTVSAHADYVLRETFGIDRVKAVNANGKKYLYTPFEIPDLDVLAVYFGRVSAPRRWLLAEFVARHIYHLHVYMPGDGMIHHNGSNSFLPSDYSREQWPELNSEPEENAKPPKDYVPRVSAELIQNQLSWFAESALRTEAAKWAARLTNPAVAQDIVQQTYLKLFQQISGGQCEATDAKGLHDYVLTAVQFKCRTAAKNGKINGDVIPDLLTRKGLTEPVPEREDHWAELCPIERVICAPTYQD